MKPRIEIASGVTLAYTLDDYTDPWREAETIILVHGIAESGEAWRGWVPHLARNYKVIRLDLRGFGDSTPMPLDYEWSLDGLADDLDAFVTRLGLARVHLAGAKLGGLVSMKFAATRPQKIHTLIVSGATVKLDFLAPSIPGKVRRARARRKSSATLVRRPSSWHNATARRAQSRCCGAAGARRCSTSPRAGSCGSWRSLPRHWTIPRSRSGES